MEGLSGIGAGVVGGATTSFAGSAFSGATNFVAGSGTASLIGGVAPVISSGGGFSDFFNNPRNLQIGSSVFQGVSALFSGFNESSLRDSNIDFIETEIRLAAEAGALDRAREKKKFIALQKEGRAAAAGSGLSGFDDIFTADAQTFELEQLISKFNTEVFIFGRRQNIKIEQFRSDTAITSGFNSAIGQGFKLASALNPPTQKDTPKLKLGQG